jgi:hypothetical protein
MHVSNSSRMLRGTKYPHAISTAGQPSTSHGVIWGGEIAQLIIVADLYILQRMHGSRRQIGLERLGVTCLHIHSAWTGKFADKTLARCCAGDDTSRSGTLQYVLAIPCNKVAIVDDILLAFHKLETPVSHGLESGSNCLHLSLSRHRTCLASRYRYR